MRTRWPLGSGGGRRRLRSFGRGSGESIQMKFDGDGFVVVQPYEEITFQGKG